MLAKRIDGATHNPGAPAGWNEDRSCVGLPIRVVGDPHTGNCYCESAWELQDDEIAHVISGGSVILRVHGWQPPVALYVEPGPVEDAPLPTSYRVAMGQLADCVGANRRDQQDGVMSGLARRGLVALKWHRTLGGRLIENWVLTDAGWKIVDSSSTEVDAA